MALSAGTRLGPYEILAPLWCASSIARSPPGSRAGKFAFRSNSAAGASR